MNGDRQRLSALIESVIDGDPVDWKALEATADASRQRLLGHLRLVARVAEVHRSASRETILEPDTEEWQPPTSHAPSHARWGHLELLERIGEGSFGEVYRARDPWLDREVALKLLKASVTDRVSPRRIVSEARTLARLHHPNVVTIFGADSHDGRVGLWMELVRGRTLSAILAAQGPFSAGEAVVVGQEVCRALSAVHAAGVVHQDVKAQNVMRESGGRLVLMDFGAGSTPLYCAPEVLAGARSTVASDIYSVGVLLFHLVTGRYPVQAISVSDLETAHVKGTRLRLADARPDLPDAFVAVVERALQAQSSDRFGGATEMRDALSAVSAQLQPATATNTAPVVKRPRGRLLGIAAALALAAALLVAGLYWRPPLVPPDGATRSVAVLPFRAIGSDPETVFYSEGLSEDLTVQLASLASVQVVGGTSTRRYQQSDQSTTEIGRALDVDVLVSGSVRLSSSDIRVAVEVIDTDTSQQLWANVFERPRQDVVSIQSEVVQQVALALKGGGLTAEDESRLKRHTTQPQAFELYLKGRYYWNTRTPDGLRRSVSFFNDAIAIDPASALPQAGLADAYMLMAFYYLEAPAIAHTRAEAAALEALRLDPNLAQAHAALGSLRLTQFRWAEAEQSLERAIELNPSYASAHQWYGLFLTQHRRFSEALDAMRAAREADPFSYVLRSATAYVYYAARDYDAAAREYRQVLDVDPGFYPSHIGLIETLAARGSYDEAMKALDDAAARTGRADDLSVQAAYVYALAGRRDEALQRLRQVEARLETHTASRADIGSVYGVLGDGTRAFEWLTSAVQHGDTQLGYLAIDPRFDSLRTDPRFDALMASVGLSSGR